MLELCKYVYVVAEGKGNTKEKWVRKDRTVKENREKKRGKQETVTNVGNKPPTKGQQMN